MKKKSRFLAGIGIYATFIIALALTLTLTGCVSMVEQIALQNPEVQRRLFVPKPDHTVNGHAEVSSVGEGTNTIKVINLWTSNYYSFGYHVGRKLSREVDANVTSLIASLSQGVPKIMKKAMTPKQTRELVDRILDRGWKIAAPYIPQSELDEMQGLADGLRDAGIKGITVDMIHRIYIIPDVSQMTCSALVAGKSATSDGHVWQLRLLDYGGFGLEKNPLITVYHPTKGDENTVISVGWAGFTGIATGMNDKGVCISEMGYRQADMAPSTLSAKMMTSLLKEALRYSQTTEGAVSIIRLGPRNNRYVYLIGDQNADFVGMVTDAKQSMEFRVNQYTNEVTHGEYHLPQFKDVIYAGHSVTNQCHIVEKMRGSLDLAHIQQMSKEIGMKRSNFQVVIFDLTTLEFWVANKHEKIPAFDCEYVRVPKEVWNRKP